MIRITCTRSVPGIDTEQWKQYIEASGLSTDIKPVGYATGSIFCEVDTGKVLFFDEVSEKWVEQFSFMG